VILRLAVALVVQVVTVALSPVNLLAAAMAQKLR
jgi:hypothetical protein